MILSETQEKLVHLLAKHKYLCFEQIHGLLFYGKTQRNTEIFLKKLEERKIVHRIKSVRSSQYHFGIICYLEKLGWEYVEQNKHLMRGIPHYTPVKKPISSLSNYAHRKKLVDFHIQLDFSVAQIPSVRVKNYLLESFMVGNGQHKKVASNFSVDGISLIADMAFVLENTQGKESAFFVEIDTSKESISGLRVLNKKGTLLEKFQNYEALLGRKEWRKQLKTKENAFRVLVVTETERHLGSILNMAKRYLEVPEIFLGSTHECIALNGVFEKEVWIGTEEKVRLI